MIENIEQQAQPEHAAEVVTNTTLYQVVEDVKQAASGLIVEGLDLIDLMEYDLLRILGRSFLEVNETLGSNGHAN